MVLAEVDNIFIKIFVTCWAFIECIFLAGVGYGWASFVFIFKEEGIYSDLCTAENVVHRNTSGANESSGTGGSTETSTQSINAATHSIQSVELDAGSFPTCLAQDSLMSLCFTISVLCLCFYSVVVGQIHFKFGTRISRLISL